MDTKQYGPYNSVDSYPNPISRDHTHWFSPDTKRFFASRISENLYGGRVFISSERDTYSHQARYYTVRIATADGQIEDYGTFQQYASRNGAHKAAERFAQRYAAELPTMTAERVREINES